MKSKDAVSVLHGDGCCFLNRAAIPESEPAEAPVSLENLAFINRLAPNELRAEDVYVRSMYLCSDQVCPADWGRFTENALREICTLVVGRAVLRGHDRSSLPLARFFRAEVVQRDDEVNPETAEPVRWVRAWFYWLRETSRARDLLLNIDGGVYREVSISWRYRSASCSICGEDIRVCEHTPGRTYGDGRCQFVVDEVLDVLEGSLVYRGAESHALLAGARAERAASAGSSDSGAGFVFRLRNLLVCLSQLPRSSRRAVVSGPVDGESVRALKSLGFRVQVVDWIERGDGWLGDRWGPFDRGLVDLWLIHWPLRRGIDAPGAAFDLLPGGPARARRVILRVESDSREVASAERRARRSLQRLGYVTRFLLQEDGPGCTLFAERSRS